MSVPADYYDLNRVRPEVLEVLNTVNALGPNFAERSFAIDTAANLTADATVAAASKKRPFATARISL